MHRRRPRAFDTPSPCTPATSFPEDGPAEWVTGARERYRVRAAEAASSLAHLELHLGERRSAVAAASRAVEIDPWLDESWRTLVTVHRSVG